MLGVIYTGLREDYSNDQIEFDRSVKNPGRIASAVWFHQAQGPQSTQSDRTGNRQIIDWPREWRQVSLRSLEGCRKLLCEPSPTGKNPCQTACEPRRDVFRFGGLRQP